MEVQKNVSEIRESKTAEIGGVILEWMANNERGDGCK